MSFIYLRKYQLTFSELLNFVKVLTTHLLKGIYCDVLWKYMHISRPWALVENKNLTRKVRKVGQEIFNGKRENSLKS